MRPILQPCARVIPAFRRYLFRSAGTLSSPELNDSLHRHITTTKGDRKASFIPVLDQWKQQGKHINPSDLRSIIETLSESYRFPQALKVSEWMSDKKVCDLVPEDFAARLHLIDNVLGFEAAEKFFQSIPEDKRDHSVYNTILSLYARSDQTRDKAEFIFWKMGELGYLSKPSAFNHMVSLYIELDKQDMVEKILKQMEENNVKPNNLTFNLKLRRYAAVTNIKTMERLLKEHDPTPLDWRTSCEIAKAYLKHGLVVKAVGMLSRAEQSVDPMSKKLAYESLMMLYGDAGKADEVYRIWELYKDDVCHNDLRHMNSEGYRSVISSLLKLNDINGADKIVKEWHEGDNEFDVRILSMMASAYCKRGQLRDAEKLTHNVMMRKYHKDRPIQMSGLLVRVFSGMEDTNGWYWRSTYFLVLGAILYWF